MWDRDFNDEYSKQYFGANLKKAKANYDKELKRAKAEFKKEYLFAPISKFKFWVKLLREKLVQQIFTTLKVVIIGKLVPRPSMTFLQARFTGVRQKFGTCGLRV